MFECCNLNFLHIAPLTSIVQVIKGFSISGVTVLYSKLHIMWFASKSDNRWTQNQAATMQQSRLQLALITWSWRRYPSNYTHCSYSILFFSGKHVFNTPHLTADHKMCVILKLQGCVEKKWLMPPDNDLIWIFHSSLVCKSVVGGTLRVIRTLCSN